MVTGVGAATALGKYLTLMAPRESCGIPSLTLTALWKSSVHLSSASFDVTEGGLALTYAVAWSLHSLHGRTSAKDEKNIVALFWRSSDGEAGYPAAA